MSHETAIYLHNTLTRKKERLRTTQPERVTMYVCGPTVYNYAHIGNARPAVVFDILSRLLHYDYPQVIYARNFTDVDDKINTAAAASGVSITDITDRYIRAYHQDMQSLGVHTPDIEPRVTEHIPDIIELIQTLIARSHAYFAQRHVLFDVQSYPEYGHLSGRRAEDMLAGARVEVAPYKRNPMDFVLWKPSTANLPGWESPWGRGRPGWHVECTAMISRHLGATIDIHGGGQDLIFPHHENEIAQGTCAHGQLYCHTWVHNSFVTVNGQKMSKSLGNVLLTRDLLSQAPGEAIRLALLSTHYRKPLDWTVQRLQQACDTLTLYYNSLLKFAEVDVLPLAEPDRELVAALRNDLNVPSALVRLRALLSQLNNASTENQRVHAKSTLLASANLMGLLQQAPEQALAALRPKATSILEMSGFDAQIEHLVKKREQARKERDFAEADAFREQLEAKGFLIEDTPKGPLLRAIAKGGK